MNKIILCGFLICLISAVYGQAVQTITGAENIPVKNQINDHSLSGNHAKNLTCTDTLYYPYFKETRVGTSTFFGNKAGSGEKASQTFLNSSPTMVTGARFECAIGGTNTSATVTVHVDLYDVDAAFTPTTAIPGASGTVDVSGITVTEYGLTFSSPVSVTGNYAVVLSHVSASDTVKFIFNNAGTTTYGEGLAFMYSGSTWHTVNSVFGGVSDPDVMAYPVVSYATTAAFTVSEDSVCVGTPITFTATNTPTAVLSNRMYNANAFGVFWGIEGDTLNEWIMNGSAVVWSAASHTYTYASAGTYNPVFYVFGGFKNTCTDYYSIPITVFSNPAVTASASLPVINPGNISTLTAGGAVSYTWDNGLGSGSTFNVSPTVSTTYNVTGTDANSCSADTSVTITVNTVPVVIIIASTSTICYTQPVTLTGQGANTYSWSTGQTAPSITFTPSATTTYSVTGQDINGLTNSASVTITVHPPVTGTASASPSSVCPGGYSWVTGTGGIIYVWNNGFVGGSMTVYPTVTTTYTVTICNSMGCTGTATAVVYVNSPPVITIPPVKHAVCEGGSIVLTATGADTYTWSHGLPPNSSNTVSPVTTTIYSVTGTNIHGCTASTTLEVNVNSKPIVTAEASPPTVCAGLGSNISAGGALLYEWDHGLGADTTITVTPLSNTTYTVTGTDGNGCTNTASVNVNVISCPHPDASLTASTNEICVGQSVTYSDNSSGVNVHSWAWSFVGGSTEYAASQGSHTITYNTAGSFPVTLSVTDDNGMDDTTITIIVHSLPSISASASPLTVCPGNSSTLTASGAGSFVWSGAVSSNPYVVTPVSTDTYTVTGTDGNGCQNTASVTVTFNPAPAITLDATNTTVCSGNPVILTAAGGASYIWDQSLSGTVNTVYPAAGTTYSVTGTDENGCTNTASVSINVNPVPVVSASASPVTVCAGMSSVLTASGDAPVYSWDGFGTTNPLIVIPGNTTTYTVTATNGSGCTATADVTITVSDVPAVVATASPVVICAGDSAILNASGAATYQWVAGSLINPYVVTPGTTTTYTVTGSDASGCSNTTAVTVTVNTLPVVTVIFPSELATVCKDSLVALSGGSPAGGVWSGTGVSGSDFLANAAGTFTITYTYTDGNSCLNSATGAISVENCTSISEYNRNELVVYPNPAHDYITIVFGKTDATQVNVAISDISGRLVSEKVFDIDDTSVQIPLYQLPAGIYTLKVTLGSDILFSRIECL